MAASEKTTKRTATREQRRRQLIDATMKCIARNGMSSTSIGDVASEAGLSQGIVNLHFESKDNLLTETLRFIADEYKTRFNQALERSPPDAASKLQALMELDLRPSILDRRKLAVWFAFWGEVKSRPRYREVCEKSDEYYDEVVCGLCEEIIADGRYRNVSAAAVATALTSMTNGLWLAYLISPARYDRHIATNTVNEYLHCVFPDHFPL